MRTDILVATVLVGLQTVSANWANMWAGNAPLPGGSSAFNFYWGYKIPFPYGTQYRAGPGPYYDSTVLAKFQYPCNADMHYEEYSGYQYMNAQGFGAISIGSIGQEIYSVGLGAEVQVYELYPYKQLFYFERGMSQLWQGLAYSTGFWVAGLYSFHFGQANLQWSEDYYTFKGDFFQSTYYTATYAEAAGTTYPFTPHGASGSTHWSNSWTDPYLQYDLIDLFANTPADAYVGDVIYYNAQIFA